VGKGKDPISRVIRGTETSPAPGKAKVGKANLKGKEHLLALPRATAAPNPAATVGKLDMSTETVANDCGMKNMANQRRNPHTIITPNMRLTFRWMRPP
jgi:hypothetical protein